MTIASGYCEACGWHLGMAGGHRCVRNHKWFEHHLTKLMDSYNMADDDRIFLYDLLGAYKQADLNQPHMSDDYDW